MPVKINHQCIYCKKDRGPFCREHVIPQAFGSFGNQTMVLAEEVCCRCNTTLGAELDEILARDSYEALIRIKHLPLKRPKLVPYQSRQAQIRIPNEDRYGTYRGARMSIDWGTRKLKPLSQVLVRDKKGVVHSFVAEELAQADGSLFRNRSPGSIWIIGNEHTIPVLMKLAKDKGARFTAPPRDTELPPAAAEGYTVVEISGFIYIRVWRAIYPGIRAHVSLFNSFPYEILLCPELQVFTRLNSGHAFDPAKKRVERLVGIPKSIWVPGKP